MSSSIIQIPILLLSSTCDDILLWMIEIWIKIQCNPQEFFKRMINDVGLTFSVGDTIPQFTLSIEQDNWNWWSYWFCMFISTESI